MSKVGLMSTPDDLIRSSEAAALLGMTQRTFNRRVGRGDIAPATTLPGDGTRLFRRSDVEALKAAA